MSTFVLVHGSWHGAWCWYKVVPRLERAGHRVIAPDLPSLGKDKTPISRVSLRLWTDSICQLLDTETEPAVLVGHSRGGVVISEVAESRPEKVKLLVYLCAFLLRSGESLMQVAETDGASLLRPNLLLFQEQGHATVREEGIRELFYGDCHEEDVALARLLLQPEALAPSGTPIQTTEERFGRIPRVYIECRRDRTLSPSFQKQMYSAVPCERVISMDTDHSPFFSAPDELVAHLNGLSAG
jgi:pimeloyl-ACP methyl ester carboxylesterase